MTVPERLILASTSPRRRELLAQLGVPFRTLDAGVDESVRAAESPAVYAVRLAREKALSGWRLGGGVLPALGADTIVVLADEVLQKPVSGADAMDMLTRLSGRRHEVYSAVALALDASHVESRLNVTGVEFAPLPRRWIESYVASGEPMDKAGAYGVQGAAARWVRHIDGSFYGVMGLPLFETAQLLQWAGLLR